MQLIPVFKIGILNAWIFVACYFLIPFLIMLINKEAYKKLGNPPGMNKREKVIGNIDNIIIYIASLYSIFLPFKLETAWFYVGLFIFILGLSILTIATINFLTTPLNLSVTTGIYHYSRNPLYFATFLIFLGIGIATASWIILVAAIIFLILTNNLINSEERYCKEKYGYIYKEYLNRTPRWIGIPKL
jgi:protein-S-isoprenylcysteine O-methyltransferase Ste14